MRRFVIACVAAACASVVCLAFAGCSAGSAALDGAQEEAPEEPIAVADDFGLDASVTVNGLTVDYPSEWKTQPDTNMGDKGVEAVDILAGTYGIVGIMASPAPSESGNFESETEAAAQEIVEKYRSDENYQFVSALEEANIGAARNWGARILYQEKNRGFFKLVFSDGWAWTIVAFGEVGKNSYEYQQLEAITNSFRIEKGSPVGASVEYGEGEVVDYKLVDFGNGGALKIKEPTMPEGERITGWEVEGDSKAAVERRDGYIVLTGATKDVKLTPEIQHAMRVTFEDGAGNVLAEVPAFSASEIKAPDDPEWEGYEFAGWDTDLSTIVEDATVKAMWKKLCKVTFTDGNGSEIQSSYVKEGEAAEAPKSPKMDGMDFVGWDVDFSSVTEDLTVNATWKAKPTTSQSNAVRTAKDYIKYMPFSYTGLIGQLEYEGYSTEDATYGADNCGADWYEQAAKSAQDYLDFMGFSRSGLIDQLQYEGYTYDQAVYGVDSVGL